MEQQVRAPAALRRNAGQYRGTDKPAHWLSCETVNDETVWGVGFNPLRRRIPLRGEGGRGVLRRLLVHATRGDLTAPKCIFVFTFPTSNDLPILVRAVRKENVEQRRTASLGST